MAIVTQNTGTDAYLLGMATKQNVETMALLTLPFVIEDERDWDLRCCGENIVMASLTDSSLDKNDMTAFIFKMTRADDLFEIELYKDGVKIDDITDDSYGRYWNVGDITEYADQVLLCGIELDWNKVLAAHGIGNYYLNFLINLIDYPSYVYRLYEFDIKKLNGYVKFESYMNGLLLRKRINYRDLNIRHTQRLKGVFGLVENEIETTNDMFTRNGSNNRELVQRKVNHIDIYTLETLPLLKCQSDDIFNYHFLANELYMSDYNAVNYSYDYIRKKVYIEDAPERKYSHSTREVIIVAKLKESIQDNEKRNYF